MDSRSRQQHLSQCESVTATEYSYTENPEVLNIKNTPWIFYKEEMIFPAPAYCRACILNRSRQRAFPETIIQAESLDKPSHAFKCI